MEATRFYEVSIDFQQTTWRDIPDDRTLQNNRHENIKFHELTVFYPWILSYMLHYFYWVSEANVVNNGLDLGVP
jgi:hypothetical protein